MRKLRVGAIDRKKCDVRRTAPSCQSRSFCLSRSLQALPRFQARWAGKIVGDHAPGEVQKFSNCRPYSVRKACIGFRCEARTAGKMQARDAMKSRVRMTAAITTGSYGAVP